MNSPANPAPENHDQPNFSVKGQYIKDLSFENPHAPQSLVAINNRKPAIDVRVDLNARPLQDNLHEMTLLIAARAVLDDNTLFMIELAYAGIFHLTNIPPDRLEAVLMIDCPFVLFPFARRVIADVTRDGGFPPLMLDPVDFQGIYLQKKRGIQATATA